MGDACYRYIEANPVRAGMVAATGDHRWSSHGRNAHGRIDPLVEDHDCYRALGDTATVRQAAYRAHFEDLAPEAIDTLRDATQRGWVPGSDGFRRQVEALLGRSVAAPTRGRPRKAT
jgi:putative transposase